MTRQISNIKSQEFGLSKYDSLIDNFDPGCKSSEIKITYQRLKTKLPDLMNKIIKKQSGLKILPFKEKIDEQTQKAIGIKIMEKMSFNFDYGRLDKSTHPFCIGSNDDVRITTRYDEKNFLNSLYGIIHETGHALYQQNLPAEFRDQPIGSYLGMSFHESQSLIMEMQACCTKEFCHFLAKLLRDDFNFQAVEYDEENLYNHLTKISPGFIRVNADEVTYPFHVILRFEIEQEINDNNLQAKDLPRIWQDKMVEYFGLIPKNDANGCLQDIHWPSGMIGYFPSYTNGAIIASMIMKKAKSQSKVKSEIKSGNFSPLNDFLNKNLRSYGCIYDRAELLHRSTGAKEINADVFLEYLEEKYLA